jgi:hypothetical protein
MFPKVPLTRQVTDDQQRRANEVRRHGEEYAQQIESPLSGDGIQQTVLDKWQRINPAEKGQ